MILINPPVVKPSEPPPGVARLSGALAAHGIEHTVVDANLEGLLYLLSKKPAATDTWTKRAVKNIDAHLETLKNPYTYRNRDKYTRAVKDMNRLLSRSCGSDISISLTDYQAKRFIPLRSADLRTSFTEHQNNPFFPYFSARLSSLIESERPRMVGFSLNYLSQALCAFAMAGFIKTNYPAVRIVFGGGLVTSWLSNPEWKNPFHDIIDNFSVGPGEKFLLEASGITLKQRVFFKPDYSQFALAQYFSPGTVIPYAASTGCYWGKCAFCPEKAENSLYLPINARQVTEELRELVNSYSPALMHLTDNAVSPRILKAIAEHPPGAPWYCFTRMATPLIDLDFCRQLRKAGCVLLKLGLESGDQKVLEKMRKGLSLPVASRVLSNLKNAGIASYIYILFGTPYESPEEAKKTALFIAEHHDEIDFLNVAIFNLPLRSPDSKSVSTMTFYEGDLSLYSDFIHPSGWNRRNIRAFLEAVDKYGHYV